MFRGALRFFLLRLLFYRNKLTQRILRNSLFPLFKMVVQFFACRFFIKSGRLGRSATRIVEKFVLNFVFCRSLMLLLLEI